MRIQTILSLTKAMLIVMLTSTSILFSCGPNTPRINYDHKIDTTSLTDNSAKDTTKVLVAELPVKFDSTDVLLYPIGLINLQEGRGYAGSMSHNNSEVGSRYDSRDELGGGDFINIIFQLKDGSERKLTDKKIKIRSASFLRDIFRKTKTGYLIYSISDRDSNGDEQLTNGDLEALYISRIDGSDFRKLTKEQHELYDWKLTKSENRIYFRTLEDKNKDGELNNQDTFHYYYIEFAGGKYSMNEYNPLRIFK